MSECARVPSLLQRPVIAPHAPAFSGSSTLRCRAMSSDAAKGCKPPYTAHDGTFRSVAPQPQTSTTTDGAMAGGGANTLGCTTAKPAPSPSIDVNFVLTGTPRVNTSVPLVSLWRVLMILSFAPLPPTLLRRDVRLPPSDAVLATLVRAWRLGARALLSIGCELNCRSTYDARDSESHASSVASMRRVAAMTFVDRPANNKTGTTTHGGSLRGTCTRDARGAHECRQGTTHRGS